MQNRITPPDDDILILGLAKGVERYVVFYAASQRVEALRVVGRWASNPELSITWHDAANLSIAAARNAKNQQDVLRGDRPR